MNPIIIIPVFNSNNKLEILLAKIRSLSSIPIIIIDDGSMPPVKNNFLYPDIEYIANKQNLGKGFALCRGLDYAFSRNYTHAITIDADLQHDPEFIQHFLSIDENISLVYGKRIFNNLMPFHRKISNFISSKIISILTGKKILDSQCGFRRYRLLDFHSNQYNEKGFQFESEIMMKFLKKGLLVKYIDISTIYADEESSIDNLHDSFKFIRFIFRFYTA